MPSKPVTTYQCTACGYEARRWLGRCPGCGAWNTLEEQVAAPPQKQKAGGAALLSTQGVPPQALPEVPMADFARTSTGIGEFDRVLGGGIVQGSVVLIGGDPGIGKSTLLLQMAENLGCLGTKVLYVSGEESARQVALRARRLGAGSSMLQVYSETCADRVLFQCDKLKPEALIIDSIQTMFVDGVSSSAGSVVQIRESAAAFLHYAKQTGCPVFLVGHVTKAGNLAGPRMLEHMVDTVLYFEGEAPHAYRVLRAEKNRYGSTNEVGLFEMGERGMSEVKNPSEMLLSDRVDAPGSVVAASLEGTRPMLVEIQALVCATAFGTPRRMATGFDYNRMVLLSAVLEKRASLRLYDQDIYLNVAGGLRLNEPASDLAAALAIASALRGKKLPERTAVMGELGLTGEIRPINRCDSRVSECLKSGFTNILLPKRNLKGLNVPHTQTIVGISDIGEALDYLL